MLRTPAPFIGALDGPAQQSANPKSMKITRTFPRVFFQPLVVREAYGILASLVTANPMLGALPTEKKPELLVQTPNLLVERGRDRIDHDDEEQFFADYRRVPERALFSKNIGSCKLLIHYHNTRSDVSVECSLHAVIDAVLNHFEESALSNRLPDPPPAPKPKPAAPPKPEIFIGHGHSGQWRELKDHLADKHNLDVVA